jgi:2-dehydro-3-deoxyphosphogluconate aldolase/(4S)-4-hydroxy-2-oxoglutarate aldolase
VIDQSRNVLAQLTHSRIVPVVTIDDVAQAADIVQALVAGGIHCAEITLRTPAGLASVAAVSGFDDFLVGAGTVLTPENVDACADNGARFVVSPGFDESVVERARERGLLALPGVATATEIQRALKSGLNAVKFFPADRLGGLDTIAALSAPFPNLRFMPSGGVGPSNVASYLAHTSVFAVGGSWMVPRDAIRQRDYARLTTLSKEASDLC